MKKTHIYIAFLSITAVILILAIPYVANAQYGCVNHSYRLCAGNSIYWYDSCGNQQDLYYTCATAQICQYGQCVAALTPAPVENNYKPYYRTACYNNSVYWYDSLGTSTGLQKNCSDGNSCTLDLCSNAECSNVLKCDGSTCPSSSADYKTYCSAGESQENNVAKTGLILSFFTTHDPSLNQWQKAAEVNSNDKIYFMISATNNSISKINDVNISANIPNEISSLGNLRVDEVLFQGNISSGINIGSVEPETTKLITFEGRTQTISENIIKEAFVTSNVSGKTQTDFVSINIEAQEPSAPAAVTQAPLTSGFVGFLKRWYLWILGGIVLIFLFVVVFRRLSSEE